jgi:4-hydroxythreonine-4-phosphate dehydrogenase
MKPIIGILLGDSAGIGPELIAKTAADGFLQAQCRPVIIGDSRVFEKALRLIGKQANYYCAADAREADWGKGIPFLDQKDQDPARIETAKVQAQCGRAVLNMIKLSCGLCAQGLIQGVCFAPFNKASQKEAGSTHASELGMFAECLGYTGHYGELNVLHNLMTTRITSHIPLKDVSSRLTEKSILDAITLSYSTLRKAGIESPRIAVAALNPHGGENGRCGKEEIEVIAPAIKKAADIGMPSIGPLPADTIFIKAFAGEFDCVVTMYHDQGQIAIKLKGFEEGISVLGGLPYAIATPDHGTAFDIAGKGIAKTSSFENAVKYVARMIQNSRR